MHTRTINNFDDYVAFIADHVSPNWQHYSKEGADAKMRLEEIFGEPKSYPVTVGIEWERGDESGYSLPVVGFVELRPTLHRFKS